VKRVLGTDTCSLNVFTQSQAPAHCVAHLSSETVLRFLSPPERLSKSGRTPTILDSSPVLFNKDVPSILIGDVGPLTHLRAAAGSLRLNHNSSTMQSQDAKYVYCVDSGLGEPEAFRIREADNHAVVITEHKNIRRVDDFLRGNERSTTIVRTGPYRFSRNPIYWSFILLVLGLSVWLKDLWPLVTLVPAIGFLAAIVIPARRTVSRAQLSRPVFELQGHRPPLVVGVVRDRESS
jgi:hypothetical protein